jgi:hypothetical protein
VNRIMVPESPINWIGILNEARIGRIEDSPSHGRPAKAPLSTLERPWEHALAKHAKIFQ